MAPKRSQHRRSAEADGSSQHKFNFRDVILAELWLTRRMLARDRWHLNHDLELIDRLDLIWAQGDGEDKLAALRSRAGRTVERDGDGERFEQRYFERDG